MQLKNKIDHFLNGPSKAIPIKCGPFNFRISCSNKETLNEICSLYRNFTICEEHEFIDFDVSIRESNNLIRRYFSKQANFFLDSHQPFKPLPAAQGYPMLEWGMNWCIASTSHQYLIIHAAVINKNETTILMPAPPGSGKSTLTALLTYSGWRLLSDELALIRISNLKVDGLARPINLKNQSIDVIRNKFPQINHSKIVHDTHKGTVCLFEPPIESIENVNDPVHITHVIFPKYDPKTEIKFNKLEKDSLFFSLIENSFNYNVLGEVGFDTMLKLVESADGLQFSYSDNDAAIAIFEKLANENYDN